MKILVQYLMAFTCLAGVNAVADGPHQLTLESAISLAQESDPWLESSLNQQRALVAQSVAAAELPDPMVTLGFANLPTDTFDFGQEPMTQFQVGISQTLPRGSTRRLEQSRMVELSGQQPLMRQERRAKVAVSVSYLWLEIFRYEESIRLIEKNRHLFEQLVDVANSNYTTALRQARQQDLIRAQLELTQLEDRLTVLHQKREALWANLGEWLPEYDSTKFYIGNDLPDFSSIVAEIGDTSSLTEKQMLELLVNHPAIKNYDQMIAVAGTSVELMKQKYQPEWRINAGYGYREDDPMGNDRSDFFSLGVAFDLPLFTARRQDKLVQAANNREAAAKSDRLLALRTMRSNFAAAKVRMQRLNQREALYADRLLNEIHDQAESSLNAYTNDVGDFSEAVRGRIAELNAKIDFLNIRIDRMKTLAELNYFFASKTNVGEEGITL